MRLESNPITRKLGRILLSLEDVFHGGQAFPSLKRIKQATNSHCGPAVLAALFSFVGLRVSQRAIVRSLRAKNKIKDFGLTIKEMAKAARIAGKGEFQLWKKTGTKISDVDLAVNKYKYPVGVEWQGVFYENDDGDSGHYGIVTKIDKKRGILRLLDPYHVFVGVDRKFKIKDFSKWWWDENEIKVAGTSRKRKITDYRLMFVITPKGESWPKKLGMTKAS
ncbi:MAG TPA: hypothetical protein VJ227_00430 [Patescibacteria group bacterium]|nr:hypothetical protein [Patescibacteria group bacterium]